MILHCLLHEFFFTNSNNNNNSAQHKLCCYKKTFIIILCIRFEIIYGNKQGKITKKGRKCLLATLHEQMIRVLFILIVVNEYTSIYGFFQV